MYRIRFNNSFNAPHYFRAFDTIRDRKIGVSISMLSWFKAKKLKTVQRKLEEIKEFHKETAILCGTEDVSHLYWIEEYEV